MAVIFSKACEYGLQAALYLATFSNEESVPVYKIAKELKIPKEFVAKILQSLTDHKLISSKKGKFGGFSLAKSAKKIKLIDIVEAIDGLDAFKTCVLGFPHCSSDVPCPVHETWGKLRNQAYDMLSNETLEDLKEQAVEKIKSL
ncbi:MAG: Rrf2 family transcriptional regulator [Ignavibacteria bacterium]|nr:Rrf2 family transcriptional regulator [Ignavibacteria bacterium]